MVTTLGMYVSLVLFFCHRFSAVEKKMPQHAFCLFVRSCIDGNDDDDESFISPECPKGGSMPLNVLYCEKRGSIKNILVLKQKPRCEKGLALLFFQIYSVCIVTT